MLVASLWVLLLWCLGALRGSQMLKDTDYRRQATTSDSDIAPSHTLVQPAMGSTIRQAHDQGAGCDIRGCEERSEAG